MVLLQQLPRIGSPVLGFVIPAAIFGVSFFVSWVLYRRFTRQLQDSNENDQGIDRTN